MHFRKNYFKVFFGKNISILAGKVSKPSSIIREKIEIKNVCTNIDSDF